MPIIPPQAILPHINKIETITSLINNKNTTEASSKFAELLKEIKTIGGYNPNVWSEVFCEKIYAFGKLLAEKCPTFLEIARTEIANSTSVEQEILCFIESEIILNIRDHADPQVSEYIMNLSKKYINNPEFIHDLALIEGAKNNHSSALIYAHQALRLNPKNNIFFQDCFAEDLNQIERLIEQEKFMEAKNYITNRQQAKTYERDTVYKNWLAAIGSRIKDHELVRNALRNKEQAIEKSLTDKLEKERFKAIELIGVFTAIIAFIFTTISFSKDFSFGETLLLEISAGVILILFVLVLSLLFQKGEKSVFKDVRFYSIGLLCLTLFLIYFFNRQNY